MNNLICIITFIICINNYCTNGDILNGKIVLEHRNIGHPTNSIPSNTSTHNQIPEEDYLFSAKISNSSSIGNGSACQKRRKVSCYVTLPYEVRIEENNVIGKSRAKSSDFPMIVDVFTKAEDDKNDDPDGVVMTFPFVLDVSKVKDLSNTGTQIHIRTGAEEAGGVAGGIAAALAILTGVAIIAHLVRSGLNQGTKAFVELASVHENHENAAVANSSSWVGHATGSIVRSIVAKLPISDKWKGELRHIGQITGDRLLGFIMEVCRPHFIGDIKTGTNIVLKTLSFIPRIPRIQFKDNRARLPEVRPANPKPRPPPPKVGESTIYIKIDMKEQLNITSGQPHQPSVNSNQPIGQYQQIDSQVTGGQISVNSNQPIGHYQQIKSQVTGGQPSVNLNQPIGHFQQINSQVIGGQPSVNSNQPIGHFQQINSQVIGGQPSVNSNQPIGHFQQINYQVTGGQPSVNSNQPIGYYQQINSQVTEGHSSPNLSQGQPSPSLIQAQTSSNLQQGQPYYDYSRGQPSSNSNNDQGQLLFGNKQVQ